MSVVERVKARLTSRMDQLRHLPGDLALSESGTIRDHLSIIAEEESRGSSGAVEPSTLVEGNEVSKPYQPVSSLHDGHDTAVDP